MTVTMTIYISEAGANFNLSCPNLEQVKAILKLMMGHNPDTS